jgi:GTPase
MSHKGGFINIIGNPNVGKSTLMNRLVGENLAIITSKSQTTRHRLMGIVNGNDFQVVYSDTPGIIKTGNKLQESMMRYVKIAIEDADIILYVTDVVETRDKNAEFLEMIRKSDVPLLVLVNKIDLADMKTVENLVEDWKNTFPKAEILPVCALKGENLQLLFKRMLELLPQNPPYYPKDELTDKPVRFFVSEIIREKILRNYHKEVPYSVEVEIESFKEEKKIVRINAVINCSRDSQKGILIGHQGKALKKTGTDARVDIEKFLDNKVFLELFVKVKKKWRDDDKYLKEFGY